jgi:DNA-binding transcriptional LysR family regulator
MHRRTENRQTMDNQIELIRIFTAATQSDSFRETASRLGTSPQVVTRAIQQLEERLGETLFHRSTRSVRITTFGKTFAVRAYALLRSVDELFEVNSDQTGSISATVRVTAPGGLGRRYVAPVLMQLMEEQPGIVIDMRLSDTLSSVVDEQIDIGVRAGFITDGRFIARRVGALPIHTVAAPRLLDTIGVPKSVDALLGMPLTALIERSTGRAWPWTFAITVSSSRRCRHSSPTIPRLKCSAVSQRAASVSAQSTSCANNWRMPGSYGCYRVAIPIHGISMSTGRSAAPYPSVCGTCLTRWSEHLR